MRLFASEVVLTRYTDIQIENNSLSGNKASANIEIRKKMTDRHTDVKTPHFFVVGCSRSGTTLLQRMINNHPSVAVADDTHLIPKGLKRIAPDRNPPIASEMVDRILGYRKLKRLGIDIETAEICARRANT